MTTSDPNTGTAPDDILAAALARYGTAGPNGELTQITGDQYVEYVLTARLAAWVDEQRPAYKAKGLKPKNIWGPLLESFVRDADTPYVRLPEPKPKRRPQPRQYRPASYWQEKVDKFAKEMEKLATPILNDRAAAGGAGLGHRRTRAVQKRMDSQLARFTALKRKDAHAQLMLRAAQQREAGR